MYRITTYSDELYHYGVIGMKWGVRRYQNYDGSRIGTGGKPVIDQGKQAREHFRNSIAGGQGGRAKGTEQWAVTARIPGNNGDSSNKKSGGSKKSLSEAILEPSVNKGKGKDQTSVAQEATRSALETTRASKDLVKALKDSDPKVRDAKEKAEQIQSQKAQKMSDKELRDSINRIKMEKEYVSLTTEDTKTGYDKAVEILEKAEPFLRVAAEIATFILLASKVKRSIGHSDLTDCRAELFNYGMAHNIPDDVIAHALHYDTDYVLNYYGLNKDEVERILSGIDNDYLEHHGVKGMHWGVRRYQNYDGTRIGTGNGLKTKPFRETIVGGQGGKATGTARLAANVGQSLAKKKEKPFRERYENARNATKELEDLGESIGRDMYEKDMQLNGKSYTERMKAKAKEDYRWLGYEEAMKRRPDLVEKEIEFMNKFDNDDIETFDYDDEVFDYYLDLLMKHS